MPDDQPSGPTRSNSGWLAEPERRALAWMAPRLPAWITPNGLTALGFAGAVISFVGYVLAASQPAWLWMVSAGLVINWFGDSLDGSVARLRGIGRPRFGFFLDQSTDVASQFLFAIGIGLSGYVSLWIAALGLAAYLMMTVQSLLRTETTRTFHLATGGMGLTEVRCLFLVGNALFFFMPPNRVDLGIPLSYGDVLGLVWIATNVGLYLWVMASELRVLAGEEPPPAHESQKKQG
jgi:archaetidylinositol phosphate synthase